MIEISLRYRWRCFHRFLMLPPEVASNTTLEYSGRHSADSSNASPDGKFHLMEMHYRATVKQSIAQIIDGGIGACSISPSIKVHFIAAFIIYARANW